MTSVLTHKFTCDAKGKWSLVPVVLTRIGNRWVESSPPSDRDEPRKAAA